MMRRYKPARGKCGTMGCSVSSTISEHLSFGSGDLDDYGFWSVPCDQCARRYEREHPDDGACWPFARPSGEEAA